jgi:hypothetical protein
MSNVGPMCNPPNHTPSLSRAHSLPGDPTRLSGDPSGLARRSHTPPRLRLTQGTPILCPEPIVSGYTKHALFTLRQLHYYILSHLSH